MRTVLPGRWGAVVLALAVMACGGDAAQSVPDVGAEPDAADATATSDTTVADVAADVAPTVDSAPPAAEVGPDLPDVEEVPDADALGPDASPDAVADAEPDAVADTEPDASEPDASEPVPCNAELCKDSNPCTTDYCHDELGCIFQAHTEPCDDGDPCTAPDLCASSVCVGEPLDCDDDDPCTEDACDPDTGCGHSVVPGCAGICGDLGCDDSIGETCQTCPEDCGPCGTDSDCCDLHTIGSCSEAPIEACVCDARPACCEGPWDAACVALASHACGAPCQSCGDALCAPDETCQTCPEDCGPCPVFSDCCQALDDPGCSDGACQTLVCALDPYCCDTQWDFQCANEASEVCPGCDEANADCGDGTCADAETCQTCPPDCGPCEVDPCCAPTEAPGCDDPECQALVCAADPFCCASAWDPPCVAVAAGWCGCAAGLGCGDGACDEPSETCLQCPADCGECPETSDCCEPHEAYGCDAPPCQKVICDADTACCHAQWDDACAAAALELCTACGGSPPAVCGDGICVEAESCKLCQADCGECPAEHCCQNLGVPGCASDPACTAAVCANDPYCCDANWDDACGKCADGGPGYDGIDCTSVIGICVCP